MVDETHLDGLKKMGRKKPGYFDPQRSAGRLVGSWNLIVPGKILMKSWEEVL